MQPTPVFLLGEFHGQRSLTGYCPRDRKESDMTEHIHTHTHTHTNIWEFFVLFFYLSICLKMFIIKTEKKTCI